MDCAICKSVLCSLWMLPSMVLKKMVMGNFNSEKLMDNAVADSVDFMVERVKLSRIFN